MEKKATIPVKMASLPVIAVSGTYQNYVICIVQRRKCCEQLIRSIKHPCLNYIVIVVWDFFCDFCKPISGRKEL